MRNKYNAIKQTYKGLKFDSKKEFHRYLVLEKMLNVKLITDLEQSQNIFYTVFAPVTQNLHFCAK